MFASSRAIVILRYCSNCNHGLFCGSSRNQQFLLFPKCVIGRLANEHRKPHQAYYPGYGEIDALGLDGISWQPEPQPGLEFSSLHSLVAVRKASTVLFSFCNYVPQLTSRTQIHSGFFVLLFTR